MARTLYSPRLSDDVVRALYREGLRRRMPMTRLADELLREALHSAAEDAATVRATAVPALPTAAEQASPYPSRHRGTERDAA